MALGVGGNIEILCVGSGSLISKLGLKSRVLKIDIVGEMVVAGTEDHKMHMLQYSANSGRGGHALTPNPNSNPSYNPNSNPSYNPNFDRWASEASSFSLLGVCY